MSQILGNRVSGRWLPAAALAAALALSACGGQKLVELGATTSVQIAEGNQGDIPPVTTGGHGSTTSSSASTSGSSTTGGHGSSTSASSSGSTSAASTTGGCGQGYGPDLDGNWTMTSQYNLQQAGLPTLFQVFTDVNTALGYLNTSGVYTAPSWLSQTFTVLTAFDSFFNQLNVTSALVLTGNPASTGDYAASETWTQVLSTDSNGNMVLLTGAGQVSANGPDTYEVSLCMPTATFANHSIGGNLSGLVTPLLDGVVSLTSQGNFNTFSSLISFVFSGICSGVGSSNPLSGAPYLAYTTCTQYLSTSLEQQIYTDINQLSFQLATAKVQGTGTVESNVLIDMGVWAGTDGAGSFNGTFSCTSP